MPWAELCNARDNRGVVKMKAATVGARVSYDRGRHLTLLNISLSVARQLSACCYLQVVKPCRYSLKVWITWFGWLSDYIRKVNLKVFETGH